MPATSSCSKLVVWSRFAHPSRPFAAGKPDGIHMGTLDTTTFQVTSDAARLSFGQVSCSRPSIVFGRATLSSAAFESRYWRVSRTNSSTCLP